MSWRIAIPLALYGAVALVTFGHAAAAIHRQSQSEFAQCEARDPKAICFGYSERAPLGGFLAALVWPLYWSWELQS